MGQNSGVIFGPRKREGRPVQVADEIVGLSAAREELSSLVKGLQNGASDRVVLVRNSSPVAVILTVEEYDRMRRLDAQKELLEDLVALLEARQVDDGTRFTLEEIKREFGIS
jgi:prevent-host-death family protein